MKGFSQKLYTEQHETVQYYLPLGQEKLHLNPLIGSRIQLKHTGVIQCSHCGRGTRKSYSQGYCYPCFKKLPQCDLCMMSPERCHYASGTCRDDEFATTFCMQPHIVYLANSSGLKVGITKMTQVPTRWIDQGAVQAMPLFEVQTRQIAGFLEVLIKRHISDKTQWQKMLKSEDIHVDLIQERDDLMAKIRVELGEITDKFGSSAYTILDHRNVTTLRYPVDFYPTKVVSLSLDKTPEISGNLIGIKGQYMIFDIGVMNMRKFSSYEIEFSELEPGLF